MNEEIKKAIEAHLQMMSIDLGRMAEGEGHIDRRRIRCHAHIRSIRELVTEANNNTILAALC